MFADRMLRFLLLLAPVGAVMVHNTRRSLCVEDLGASGKVLLRRCDLDSESQQWIWIDQSMLMNVASFRCLSALKPGPPRTVSCSGSDPAGLVWDCDRDGLISINSSMLLSIDGRRLVLSQDSQQSRSRSLVGGDICQERLRSRRASGEPDEFEVKGEQTGERAAMTEEEREYLRWFYRTEDPTTWKYVVLGVAFVCLLVGFLLLGMGAMANKNRKKIAKYKAAAALAQSDGEQLRVISAISDDSSNNPSPLSDRLPQGNKPPPPNGELSELKAGGIVVTWKDGNTSCLYSDPQEEQQEEQQVEQQEEQHVEVLTDELVPDEPVKAEE